MEAKKVKMILEFPPSVNHLICSSGRKRYLSPIARKYYARAASCEFPPEKTLLGRLKMKVIAYAPDKRRRDLDNILKAICDFLMHAKVYEDDSQIDEINIYRGIPSKPGHVEVFIEELI